MTDTTRSTPTLDRLGETGPWLNRKEIADPAWWWRLAHMIENSQPTPERGADTLAIMFIEASCEAQRLQEIDHQMWSEHVQDQAAVQSDFGG